MGAAAVPFLVKLKGQTQHFGGVVAPLYEAGAQSDVGRLDPERGVGNKEWLGAGWECGFDFFLSRGRGMRDMRGGACS